MKKALVLLFSLTLIVLLSSSKDLISLNNDSTAIGYPIQPPVGSQLAIGYPIQPPVGSQVAIGYPIQPPVGSQVAIGYPIQPPVGQATYA